jgi:hypothetical protein
MIEDKKLLAVFTYAAYKAKNCGNDLPQGVRERNMSLLKDYILTGNAFPNEVIGMHSRLKTEVENRGIRGYIYNGHYDVLKKTGFEELVTNTSGGYQAALNCAINFYTVVSSKNGLGDTIIKARNKITKEVRNLEVLAGLEKPKPGQTVSGHWFNFLEVLDSTNPQTDLLIDLSRRYIGYATLIKGGRKDLISRYELAGSGK